jgi:Double zinc ribbon
MKCPRCNHKNPAAPKFCGECGARLAAVCASCGTANYPGQKFCGECGSKLSADNAKTKLASPGSYTPNHLAEKILTRLRRPGIEPRGSRAQGKKKQNLQPSARSGTDGTRLRRDR